MSNNVEATASGNIEATASGNVEIIRQRAGSEPVRLERV